jgi:hypothetical protein
MRSILNFICPTPLGPDWGWPERLIEIAFTPISMLVQALWAAYCVAIWIDEKIWNS